MLAASPVAVQGAASLELVRVGEVLPVPSESTAWWPQRCPSDIAENAQKESAGKLT